MIRRVFAPCIWGKRPYVLVVLFVAVSGRRAFDARIVRSIGGDRRFERIDMTYV